jgi:exopolyphosphatase/guanosine-5'-triphosphate,3'-diphosphate pyrophosphatase
MGTSLKPTGIIDIGSNSVRFVAYAGAARVPTQMFNEKISPALGKGVERDGRLDADAMERSLSALARFRLLSDEMRLHTLHVVATAAVRDAENGDEFLSAIRKLGLKPVVLPGGEEAELAAMGVISSIPGARGIVADLGGGSLELAWIEGGEVGAKISLPLGVLRIGGLDRKDLKRMIRRALDDAEIETVGAGLYLVGGSFRALARLDLQDLAHALPVIHQHRFSVQRMAILDTLIATHDAVELKALSHLSTNRVDNLAPAKMMLDALVEVLEPDVIKTSSYGLREGLLFRSLDRAVRSQDPLLVAALEVGERLGRFGDHGATIDAWIAPLFPNQGDSDRRLRLAACLMSDFAWNAHPDFRAERAVDMALHGNWVGIEAHGRALVGRTLCTAFASDTGITPEVAALLSAEDHARATAWGRAIRLAQRLSGGTERILLRSSLALDDDDLVMTLRPSDKALASEAVLKRLSHLAKALSKGSRLEIA